MTNLNNIDDLFNSNLSQYPKIGGIPWCYSNQEESILSWVDKINAYFLAEKNELGYLQNLLSNNLISGSKRNRIQQFVTDKSSHLKHMSKLFSDFSINSKSPTIIDKQNILSYQDLIFRDWVWGQDEIKKYKEYIVEQLSGTEQNILILGAGSCGLSYEIAKNTKANVIATDINPYLFLTAKKLTSKKHVKLTEFVPHPNDIKDVSIKHNILPVDELSNHHMIFSDFKDMPFKSECFDLIISCWFFDIIDNKLEDSISHTNQYLKDNGSIIYIGPSNFHKNNISNQYTSTEIIDSFMEKNKSTEYKTEQISYLNNPKSSYKRIEEILFLKATNPIRTNMTPIKDDTGFEYTTDLEAYKQKLLVFSKILNNIDRSMSYDELAIRLEKDFGFNAEEAKFYSRNFMKKLFLEI
jgi:ubiquinone/menaquinone biosynthesis C-methylase UbiE